MWRNEHLIRKFSHGKSWEIFNYKITFHSELKNEWKKQVQVHGLIRNLPWNTPQNVQFFHILIFKSVKNAMPALCLFSSFTLLLTQVFGLDDQTNFQHQTPTFYLRIKGPYIPFIHFFSNFSTSRSVSVHQRFVWISALCFRLIPSFCASLCFRFRVLICSMMISVLCMCTPGPKCQLFALAIEE